MLSLQLSAAGKQKMNNTWKYPALIATEIANSCERVQKLDQLWVAFEEELSEKSMNMDMTYLSLDQHKEVLAQKTREACSKDQIIKLHADALAATQDEVILLRKKLEEKDQIIVSLMHHEASRELGYENPKKRKLR